MEPDTRVALRRALQWEGRTVGKQLGNTVYVRFDGGGGGNFDPADLVVLDGKQWPPTIETKAAPA